MRLLGLILGLSLILPILEARAEYGPCTKWERRQGYSCVYNGRTSPEWIRQCFHQWDNTLACMPQDPNTLKGPCTKWVQAQDIRTCSNGVRWERRWIRACTDRLQREEFCSDSIDPNTIGHDTVEPVDENDPRRNPNHDPRRRPRRP
ncbi:MAG TPA: hypothetical protein VFV50_05010 [Bdellovibrionales bacterium]|nr:hypothetical protein [Bdellovibrionales bacterium]